jgi:hypothetical protein
MFVTTLLKRLFAGSRLGLQTFKRSHSGLLETMSGGKTAKDVNTLFDI